MNDDTAAMNDDETMDALRREPLEIVGRFATASNVTLLCRLGDPIDERMAVYKPSAGEAPLWDFPHGTLHRREVAAVVVDRALGLGMVPATVLREDAPYGAGSVQIFVEHDPDQHYFVLREADDPSIVEQLAEMVAFDLIVNNADRKSGHVLLDSAGRVRLVDHGVCFHEQPKLRTVAWDLAGQPVPGAVQQRAHQLAVRLADGGDRVRQVLLELLAEGEVDATAARAEVMASTETFPAPSGPRPYPWPPI